MPENVELCQWAVYKAAKADNGAVVYAHLNHLIGMEVDSKQKSVIDGLLREHSPEGHFIHTWMTIKELLGDRPEPNLPLEEIEAKLGLSGTGGR